MVDEINNWEGRFGFEGSLRLCIRTRAIPLESLSGFVLGV